MKRFFLKSGIFLATFVCIFFLLQKIADTYDSKVSFRIYQLLSKRDSIEALAIGNSHTCAFDFRTLNMRGYRIAQGGNDLFEAEYQIKALLPQLPKLKTVFFNISYFTFFSDNSAVPDDYCYFNNNDYESFIEKYPNVKKLIEPVEYENIKIINLHDLSPKQKNNLGNALIELNNRVSDVTELRKTYYMSIPSFSWVKGDFINYFECKLRGVVRQDHWKGVIYNFIKGEKSSMNFDNKYYKIDEYGQHTSELVYSYLEPDSLTNLARSFQVPMYVDGNKLVSYFNKDVLEDTYNCLVSIIKFLQKNNVRVIFVTTPVYKSFTEYYEKEYITIMRNKMESLKRDYGIQYFDFSSDSTLTNNNMYYYNSDHLNRNGATEFSKKLKERLVDL